VTHSGPEVLFKTCVAMKFVDDDDDDDDVGHTCGGSENAGVKNLSMVSRKNIILSCIGERLSTLLCCCVCTKPTAH